MWCVGCGCIDVYLRTLPLTNAGVVEDTSSVTSYNGSSPFVSLSLWHMPSALVYKAVERLMQERLLFLKCSIPVCQALLSV